MLVLPLPSHGWWHRWVACLRWPRFPGCGDGGCAPWDPQLGARGCLVAEVLAHHGVGGMPGPRRRVTLSASEPSIAKKKNKKEIINSVETV